MYIDEAEKYWQAGRGVDAGRLLFEQVPVATRPQWAVGILDFVVNLSGVHHLAISRVQQIGGDRAQWGAAHGAFSQLRKLLISSEGVSDLSNKQELLLSVTSLAENVAKVIYNATDPEDEFDEDSGWWIVECLLHCAVHIERADFKNLAWAFLRQRAEQSGRE